MAWTSQIGNRFLDTGPLKLLPQRDHDYCQLIEHGILSLERKLQPLHGNSGTCCVTHYTPSESHSHSQGRL